jgi:hypothetical protein
MSVHLAEISKVVGPTAHCVLICDGAGWTRATCIGVWTARGAGRERGDS